MYSFAQRPDTKVYDEPLYAAYLAQTDGQRPYRERLLQVQSVDKRRVVEDVLLGDAGLTAEEARSKSIRFYKNMSKHLCIFGGDELAFMQDMENVVLVRHPFKVVASYYKAMGDGMTLHDTGFIDFLPLLRHVEEIGKVAPVLLNEQLLRHPERTLRRLCEKLEIDFKESMLSWTPGGIPEDGIWAYHWYKGTHGTSGFTAEAAESPPEEALQGLPTNIIQIAYDALPVYDRIAATDDVC